MKTLTNAEAIEWSRIHKIGITEREKLIIPESEIYKYRVETPKNFSKHVWLCRFIERSLRPWSRCLLWATQWGIWESSENWHLYYRLRQSYNEWTLIEEAPAHLFLNFETPDLISFLQIGIGAGWDFQVLTSDDYGRVSVSHDEWVEFVMRDKTQLEKVSAELLKSGIKSIPPKIEGITSV